MRSRRALVAAAILIAACGSPEAEAPPADAAPAAPVADTTPTTAAPTGSLNDAQIVDILAAANEVDARAGELALASASDARVKQYGQQLTVDHTGANRAGGALASRLGITPEPNPTSAKFRDDAERNRAVLERETGARRGAGWSRPADPSPQRVQDRQPDGAGPDRR